MKNIELLARRYGKSTRVVQDVYYSTRENLGPIPIDEDEKERYFKVLMRNVKEKLGHITEVYDESYFINLLEEKDEGKDIAKWIKKQGPNTKEDIIDLDEIMAKKFKIPEDKAGKIIELYVRHRAGGFNEKEFVRKINSL